MNILKNRKFIISLVAIILIVVVTVGVQVKASANERLEQYQKYCQNDCELTKVSNEQLEQTIDTRKESAITSIEKSAKSITETKSYLNSRELSDSEAKTYEAIALASEYNSEADYTIDELIDVESDYNAVAKQLHDIKTSYQARVNKTSIKSYKASISDSKEYLKSVDLSTSEKEKYDSYNKDYNAIEYDTKKNYTVKELGAFKQSYKELDTNYSKLVKSVKARIKEEEQAEAQAQLEAQAQQQANNEDTAAYSSNVSNSSNNTNTSNINDNTSTSNSSGNTSSGGRVCEYQSYDQAWAYAEANMHLYGAFGVYPCAQDTWEIYWKEL